MIRTSFSKFGAFVLLAAVGASLGSGCGSSDDDDVPNCYSEETRCIDTGNSNTCPQPSAAEDMVREQHSGSIISSVDSLNGPVNGPNCCYSVTVRIGGSECDPPFDFTPGF